MTNLKVMETPFRITDQWWFIYVRRIAIATGWLLAMGLCGWLGFQMTRTWMPNPNDVLLKDFPVIENLDQYQEAREIEFLNELKRSSLFEESPEK